MDRLRFKAAAVIVLVIVAATTTSVLAKNFDSPPPLDQIQPGDTLDYGDADVKVFVMEPEPAEQGAVVLTVPSYTGGTDIWFVYGSLFGTDSGPEGNGWTACSPAADLVRAHIVLWAKRILVDPTYYPYTEDTDQQFNSTFAGAHFTYFYFGYGAPAVWSFMGTTEHTIQYTGLGWEHVWQTSDIF